MIKSQIQIENGEIKDFYEAFGFIYMDADERTAPDEKEDAVSNYAEEAGEHRDGRTVDAPFDYTAKFLVEAPNKDLTNVNVKIANFNAAIREAIKDSDIKRKKEITFYNLLNRVKIVGHPEVIAVPTKVYHSNRYGELDFAVVELKIRVSDPKRCNFKLKTEIPDIRITLSTDGSNIFVDTSRSLKDDELLLLLRRGSAKSRIGGTDKPINHKPSGYRWHVRNNCLDDGNFNIIDILNNGQIDRKVLDACSFHVYGTKKSYGVICRKSSHSKYYYKAKNGLKKNITFGCAVYKLGNEHTSRPIRMSNVAYFKPNVRINNAGTNGSDMDYETWFTV